MRFEKERKESDLSARLEAKSIVAAIKQGLDMSQELADVSPELEVLMYQNNDAYVVRMALEFRKRVQGYVERLLNGEDIECGSETEESEADDSPARPDSETNIAFHHPQGSPLSETEAQEGFRSP